MAEWRTSFAHQRVVRADFARELERELAAAKALNKAWEQKAATWLATPEAAARLQSYRDLGQQVAQAQNESDALLFQLAAMKKQRDEARRLYRALLDGIKDAADPREKEGGGA